MAFIPEFRPMRSFILNNVRSDNDRPKAFRWLYKQHVPESLSQFTPYCTKYATYHALPLPDGAEAFGTYNWIMTEHYWNFNIFQEKNTGHGSGLAFREAYPDDFMEITCQPPSDVLRQSGWQGSKDGYHPIVFCFAPIFWEDDFKGKDRMTDDGPNFRWLFFITYPDGVSIDEGDQWFKETFAKEVCESQAVVRFLSSRVLDEPRIGPFHRVTEIWFEDSNAWHETMVENAKRFTKPDWATNTTFPFFEPYRDMTGVFIMDRPDSDHLKQWSGYVTTR